MQELKASFLDENSHLSAPGGGAEDAATLDETSQSSVKSKGGETSHSWRGTFEMQQLRPIKLVTSDTLFEYRWPLEGRNSEHYFLQEQVCEYLGLKSFKRRYPEVTRRNVDAEERDFLVEMRVVNETQADLGLTALPSTQILDIMSQDFYEKYDAYMAVVQERKDRTIRQTNYSMASVEKHKYADFVEKAVRSTASWNKKMNADRREKRSAYFDMQTFNVHYPQNNRGRMRVAERPKLGHYPVALIPGQFVDYFKSFTPEQLKHLPLNSSLRGPPKDNIRLDDIKDPNAERSDGESSSDDSDSDDSSSSGSSSSDSSSESEAEEEGKVVKEVVVKKQIGEIFQL